MYIISLFLFFKFTGWVCPDALVHPRIPALLLWWTTLLLCSNLLSLLFHFCSKYQHCTSHNCTPTLHFFQTTQKLWYYFDRIPIHFRSKYQHCTSHYCFPTLHFSLATQIRCSLQQWRRMWSKWHQSFWVVRKKCKVGVLSCDEQCWYLLQKGNRSDKRFEQSKRMVHQGSSTGKREGTREAGHTQPVNFWKEKKKEERYRTGVKKKEKKKTPKFKFKIIFAPLPVWYVPKHHAVTIKLYLLNYSISSLRVVSYFYHLKAWVAFARPSCCSWCGSFRSISFTNTWRKSKKFGNLKFWKT